MTSAEPSPHQTLTADRLFARERAELLGERERLALARAFGYRVASAWWSTLTRDAFRLRVPFERLPSVRLPHGLLALARKIGASLASLDAEAAAYHIGLTYIGMLSPAYRAANGVYYTPPALSARLIEQVTRAGADWRTARVLDPACGGGAFLAPVARRMAEAMGRCDGPILIQNLGRRLRGYELDPFAAWLSQVALDAVLWPVTESCGHRLPAVVTLCDSLRAEPPADLYDVVIGNPPYKRVRLGAEERRRFERSLFGHANLYGLFTDIAIRHAAPGGVIGYVTPTSFLAGEYFKKLRGLIAREAPPCAIDFLAGREGVFDEVLQETLLATYRRGGPLISIAIHEIDALDDENVLIGFAGDAALPNDPTTPWLLPRTRAQATLAAALARMPHRLADWGYSVSTGPLVWNRYKAQFATRLSRNRYPVVWAESVSAGGRFAWRAEKRDHAPYFEIRPGDEWMIVRDPCILLQRTTAKEQNRRLIAAPLPAEFLAEHGAAVVENHLNMVRRTVGVPPVAQKTLAAFLNSSAADRAFRCVSGSVAVSAYELESLPLPAPDELTRLNDLVASGAPAAVIEAECARLYEHG